MMFASKLVEAPKEVAEYVPSITDEAAHEKLRSAVKNDNSTLKSVDGQFFKIILKEKNIVTLEFRIIS